MQRHAGFGFAVDDRPVQRHAAAVFRQQRAVQVDRALRRNRKDLPAEHVAVVERKDVIRLHRPDAVHPDRMIDALGSEHRNVVLAGQLRNRTEPDVLVRIVLVSEDRTDLEAVLPQRFDPGAPDIMVRKHNTLHWRNLSITV